MTPPAPPSIPPVEPGRRETPGGPAKGLLLDPRDETLRRASSGSVSLRIDEAQAYAGDISAEHGFHDETVNVPEKLALIHSEVSECLEALRDPAFEHPQVVTFREDGKPEGFGPELADVVIRCLDLASLLGIDLGREVARKMRFNASRPHKHGKRF